MDITGTQGDDDLDGTSGNDTIEGLNGNDILRGLAGTDTIRGDGGNDTLYGGSGTDFLYGGAGNDTLYGEDGNDWLYSLVGGNDIMGGGAGNDTIWISNPTVLNSVFYATGGTGNDELKYFDFQVNSVTFLGENGEDYAYLYSLNASSMTLDMGADDDVIDIGNEGRGGVGTYNLALGSGSDTINIESITDTGREGTITVTDFEYGAGGDIINLNFTGQLPGFDGSVDPFTNGTLRLVQAGTTTRIEGDKGGGIWTEIITLENTYANLLHTDNFNGYVPGDIAVFEGTANGDFLSGTSGINTYYGFGGDDYLLGGFEADTLIGGTGNDSYVINDSQTIVTELANGGTDTVYVNRDYVMADFIEIGVVNNPNFVTTLTGNGMDNILIETSLPTASVTLHGEGGNDTIYLQSGSTATGGSGNDIFVALGASNSFSGNAGDDVYIIGDDTQTITEAANEGRDIVYLNAVSGSFTDLFLADNVEVGVIIGTPFQSRLYGNAIDNTLIGSAGADAIAGFGGSDFLIGGAGEDVMIGGAGLDIMQGNAGADEYYYNGTGDAGDIIQDFVSGEDAFVFAASGFGLTAGHTLTEGYDFISGTVLNAANAVPTFLWDTDNTALYFDADGSGAGGLILIADLQDFSSVTIADIEIA